MLLSLTDGIEQGSATVGSDPVAVTVSDDGKTAFVADSTPGDVYGVRLPGLTVAWKQHVGEAPFGLLLHQGRLFVSLFNGTSVAELDPTNGRKLASDPVPQGPAAMTVDGTGHIVVAGTHGRLAVIGGAPLTAGNGYGVAYVGGRLWSADYQRGELVAAGETLRVPVPAHLHPFWLASGTGNTLLIAAEGANEDTDPGGVFSYDTGTGVFKTLATPKDPDQVQQSGSTAYVAAHGEHDVLSIHNGSTRTWARGAAAVGLATDEQLGLLAVVVNAHE